MRCCISWPLRDSNSGGRLDTAAERRRFQIDGLRRRWRISATTSGHITNNAGRIAVTPIGQGQIPGVTGVTSHPAFLGQKKLGTYITKNITSQATPLANCIRRVYNWLRNAMSTERHALECSPCVDSRHSPKQHPGRMMASSLFMK